LPKLNPQQKAAVQYVNGPLLVLAGAGTGKTSVITHKIAWLIRDFGIDPGQIVGITFTNKAAREMKSRVSDLMHGDFSQNLLISTIHTFGMKILRDHLSEIGYRPGFSLYDTEDSQSLLGKLLGEQHNSKNNLAEAVRQQISIWKSNQISPSDAPLSAGGDSITDVAARVFGEYERHLQTYNAMDLDDLILKPVQLLSEHPKILQEWQQRVRYLLVDDFQDSTPGQYKLVRLLTGQRGAVTVVGDDDQCIYAWRGAHPQNLAQLQQDFPHLKTIRLEQNYRSSGRILKAANALNTQNPHLFDKSLWCDSDFGKPMRVLRARGGEHEAERVVSELLDHKFRHNADFRDYAILFRENEQSHVLERVMRERRVPYFLSGCTSFFDRTEIKDVMAYLRLLSNPADDNAFMRVINTPRRDIGHDTLEQLNLHAAELNTSLLLASVDPGIDKKLTARQEASLRTFTHWLMEMISKSDDEEPGKLVCDILSDLRYEEWLKDICNDQKIAQRRMENVLDMVGWIQRLSRQNEEMTLSDLVAQLTLSRILDKCAQENPSDLVSLMTVHAAKGMEFPHVFIVGMEEGMIPHQQCLSASGVEDERRLAYVAITRAKESLTFSYVERRKRGGEILATEPSRFLKELPPDDLAWEDQDRDADPAAMLGRSDLYLSSTRGLPGHR